MIRTDPFRRWVSVHRTFLVEPFPAHSHGSTQNRRWHGRRALCSNQSALVVPVRAAASLKCPLVCTVSAISGIVRAVAVLSTVRTCAPASVPIVLLSAASCARAALLFVHAARHLCMLPVRSCPVQRQWRGIIQRHSILLRLGIPLRHGIPQRHGTHGGTMGPTAARYPTAAWYRTATRYPTAARYFAA